MKIRLLPPLCLLAVLAGCAAPEPPPAPEPVHSASTYEQAALLAGTMEFLHQNYVDADRAGYEKLLTAALRGMMRELDPYSGYEPPAVFTRPTKSPGPASIPGSASCWSSRGRIRRWWSP